MRAPLFSRKKMGCKSSRPKADNGKTVRFSDSHTFVPAPHHPESCDESQASSQLPNDAESSPSTSATAQVADSSNDSASKCDDGKDSHDEEAVALSDAALEDLGRRRGARRNKALLSNALAASRTVNQHHEDAAADADNA